MGEKLKNFWRNDAGGEDISEKRDGPVERMSLNWVDVGYLVNTARHFRVVRGMMQLEGRRGKVWPMSVPGDGGRCRRNTSDYHRNRTTRRRGRNCKYFKIWNVSTVRHARVAIVSYRVCAID